MIIPTLQFDFHFGKGKTLNPVIFTNPVKIITTSDINKIHSCLEEVKKAIRDGYYVAGFMSYEATYAFYNIDQTIESELPLLWFGLFQEPIDQPIQVEQSDFSLSEWRMNVDRNAYLKRVYEVLQLIENGIAEQVNYTIPFEADFFGNSYAYYERLKAAQRSKYCAYLQFDEFDILSVSPELFFSLDNGTVTVKPMKGTIQRGKTFEEDEQKRNWLEQSIKNKIENDLIAELMQNELNLIANDVTIYDQYSIEKYPTVYQMTTTVKGKLKSNVDLINILTSLFPCGSISGIPKRETIEIIANIERKARGVYCGAIGYFAPDGDAIFNVPIRTVTIDKSKHIARYNAGGAITSRSIPDEEFNEIIAKTKVLTTFHTPFQLLETILLEDGKIFLKQYHIRRLMNSANYFDIPIHETIIQNKLKQLEKNYPKEKWRIRLLVDFDGNVTTEVYPLNETKQYRVILADFPINRQNVFLYHKTTERSTFIEHRNKLTKDDLDVLLWNEDGEITEFTIGNVVVQKNGELITPPVNSGLLPGTFRQYLLDRGEIREEKVHIDELQDIESMWLINSVRKWIKVSLQHNK